MSKEAYWVPLPQEYQEAGAHRRARLPIEQLAPVIECEPLPQQFTIAGRVYQAYLPRAYRLAPLAPQIRSSSHGQLFWRSHFAGQGAATAQQEQELQGVEVLALAPGTA
jgi:hypothetical protein